MISQNKNPCLVLWKEQELSRIAHRDDKWHYKGAYRGQPIFRIKGVQIWLPTTLDSRGPIQAPRYATKPWA